MEIIKTNEAMRDHYINHINKLEDYAKGKLEDETCYMCKAGRAHPQAYDACEFCPLDQPIDGARFCSGDMRRLNLRDEDSGIPTILYELATPKSIRKHTRWIEKQIKERTDCELYWA